MAFFIPKLRKDPPLLDFLHEKGYSFAPAPIEEGNSTGMDIANNIQDIIYYCRQGDFDGAQTLIQPMLNRPATSTKGRKFYELSEKGKVRAPDPHMELRLQEKILCSVMVKRLDDDVLDVIDPFCSSIYYARKKRPDRFSPAEIGLRIGEYWMALAVGQSLPYEVLPSLDADQHRDIMRRMLGETDKFVKHASKKKFTSLARPEQYGAKYVESARWIFPHLPQDPFMPDACRLESQSEKREPNIDPAATNVNLEGGELWYIDFEKLNKWVTRTHQRAHTIFDPAFNVDFDERLDMMENLDAVWFYLTRQVAWRHHTGMIVPFARWVPSAEKRFDGYVHLWKQLSQVPYIRRTYALAQHADELQMIANIYCNEL